MVDGTLLNYLQYVINHKYLRHNLSTQYRVTDNFLSKLGRSARLRYFHLVSQMLAHSLYYGLVINMLINISVVIMLSCQAWANGRASLGALISCRMAIHACNLLFRSACWLSNRETYKLYHCSFIVPASLSNTKLSGKTSQLGSDSTR